MAQYTINLNNEQLQVYAVPGSGLLRVHAPGQSSVIYNPLTQTYLDASNGQPTALSHATVNDAEHLQKELNTIDQWRKDYYGGKLKTEYPLPELKTNTQIIGLADEMDRLLALAHPNEKSFKDRIRSAKLRDAEKAMVAALWDIRNNVLAHNQLNPIISLSQEHIDSLERIRDKLAQKRQAQNIMIKGDQIFSAQWSDKVLPKVQVMLQRQYSHVPILDENRIYQGVFTGESMLKALVQESIIEMGTDTRFEDFRHIMDYHIRGNTTEQVVFTKPQTSIAKLAEQVANHRDKHVKASLFIVTASGKPTEPVQGLITVWDLPGEG
jgi:predicted transcriptional regulator